MDAVEKLSAYLDGALGPAERAALEVELAADPALAAELARLRGNDDLLQQAFAMPGEDAAEARMREAIAAAATAGTAPAADVVDFASARARRRSLGWATAQRWTWPAAAAAALVLGLFLGNRIQGPDRGPAGAIATSASFATALDRTPSSGSAAVGDGRLTPILSFAAGDGRFCRQFVLGGRPDEKAGIACRGPSGWTIEALAPHAAGPAPGAEQGYETAAGPENDSLDIAYSRLRGGDPLDAAAEQRLIRDGWRR